MWLLQKSDDTDCEIIVESRHAESESHHVSDDWLCASCKHPVARDSDLFYIDGRSRFSFINPTGIAFSIFTFSSTVGCRESGVPTLDHTWFPDHAWSFAHCASCFTHLGWYYAGPARFAGLIEDRLVRAAAAD